MAVYVDQNQHQRLKVTYDKYIDERISQLEHQLRDLIRELDNVSNELLLRYHQKINRNKKQIEENNLKLQSAPVSSINGIGTKLNQ